MIPFERKYLYFQHRLVVEKSIIFEALPVSIEALTSVLLTLVLIVVLLDPKDDAKVVAT